MNEEEKLQKECIFREDGAEEGLWHCSNCHNEWLFYEGTPEDMFGGNTHIFTMNSTKFKLGCLLSVIIFIFIIYLLFHVFSAMMVVLGPVIIIGVIVALIMKITGR